MRQSDCAVMQCATVIMAVPMKSVNETETWSYLLKYMHLDTDNVRSIYIYMKMLMFQL